MASRSVQADNQTAAASAGRAITEKMLGYSYKSFDQHTAEVSTLLTGSFRSEFVKAATTVVQQGIKMTDSQVSKSLRPHRGFVKSEGLRIVTCR